MSQAHSKKTVTEGQARGPLERAIDSARSGFWTMRPPDDIRELMVHIIKDAGRDKGHWLWDALRRQHAEKPQKKHRYTL